MTYRHTDYQAPSASVVNNTFMITVNNVSMSKYDGHNVMCFLDRPPSLHGTVLIVSKPPDQPKNLSCETRDLKTLNCRWLPGKKYNFEDGDDGQVSPKYTLHEWLSNKSSSCNSRDSCLWTIEKNKSLYNFTLIAENALGKRSIDIVVNVTVNVRPLVPTKLSTVSLTPRNATLKWSLGADYSTLVLRCQIGLQKTTQDEEQINITVKGTFSGSSYSVTLDKLQPYTHYTLRIRCAVTSSLPWWSEWSEELTLRTPEDVPAAPLDIWREITEDNADRTVTLHWRPLPAFYANGNIFRYDVSWKPQGDLSDLQHRNVLAQQNSTRIVIDGQAHIIRITAQNKAGSSPPSEIRIPAVSKNDNEIQEERTHGSDGGVYLSWKAAPVYQGYIVEWCDYPRSPHCDLQWTKFNSSIHRVTIKSSAFRPGVRYNFQIYGSNHLGEYLLEKKAGYTRELAPSVKPRVKIDKIEPDALQLNWDPYPNNELQEGFISGYNIYIKPPTEIGELMKTEEHILSDGSRVCRFSIRDPDKKNFTLKQLRANTKYEIGVTAVTEGGESDFEFIKAHTPSDTRAVILAIVLSVVMFSVTALIMLIMGYCKREWLKNLFYPDIPDPNKSNILSFDMLKGNAERSVMIPSTCRSQSIYIVKVQEPDLQGLKNEIYHQTMPPSSELNNKEKNCFRCLEEQNTQDALNDFEHARSSSETLDKELYPPQTTNYIEFFNRNNCATSDEMLDAITDLGYKPQTDMSQLSLQLYQNECSPTNLTTTNSEPDLRWKEIHTKENFSMDMTGPVSGYYNIRTERLGTYKAT
ncbi:oncostatin-M-specific receptor subunit beta isoform X2 [Spea bombifrons]|nr:oncostatin-M-specific receptor subunit beta isoform X2 [Spea bombifrons]